MKCGIESSKWNYSEIVRHGLRKKTAVLPKGKNRLRLSDPLGTIIKRKKS